MRDGPLTIALALLVPLAVVAILAAPAAHQRHRHRQAPSLPALPQIRPGTATTVETQRRGGAGGAAALAAGVAVGLLGLAVVLAVGRRGRAPGLPDQARRAVAAGAHEALAALAMPSDPRAAVLVAYARMESALAEAGLQRRPSEAPREYLAVSPSGSASPAIPTARLTALFERARFSTHAVDESMRRDAVTALEQIADNLKDDRA